MGVGPGTFQRREEVERRRRRLGMFEVDLEEPIHPTPIFINGRFMGYDYPIPQQQQRHNNGRENNPYGEIIFSEPEESEEYDEDFTRLEERYRILERRRMRFEGEWFQDPDEDYEDQMVLEDLGNYIRDEDFDSLSYENLLSLSSLIGTTSKGLSSAQISSLKRIKYKELLDAEKKKGKVRKEEVETRCPICMEDYEVTDELIVLRNCKHFAHEECLGRWLKEKTICIMCRGDVC
jgi:hypothetical protein